MFAEFFFFGGGGGGSVKIFGCSNKISAFRKKSEICNGCTRGGATARYFGHRGEKSEQNRNDGGGRGTLEYQSYAKLLKIIHIPSRGISVK